MSTNSSKSFSRDSSPSNLFMMPSADPETQQRSSRKTCQEERVVEVTTVQTIKETRTVRIDGDPDEDRDNGDLLIAPPTTITTTVTTYNQPPNEPTSQTLIIPAKHAKEAQGSMSPYVSEQYLTKTTTRSSRKADKKHAATETPYIMPSIVADTIAEVEVTHPSAMKCASEKLQLILDALRLDGEHADRAAMDSISYAIAVLDHNYQLKTRQYIDSLSRTPSRTTSVDNLVREWLTDTFTRRTSSCRPSVNALAPDSNAIKLSSVAHVVRVSAAIEKFLRTLYHITIPDELQPFLKKLYHWDFDVFELHRASGGHALRFVCLETLARFGICNRFKIRRAVLERFLSRLEEGYCLNRNPYHNCIHGADVVQATVFYLAASNLIEWLSELELFTVVIGAAIHDFEHTGTTNAFHVNTKSNLALFYNDRSVLENYHVSAVCRFMNNDPDMDIFTGISAREYKEMRALLIELVLNTDMQFHTNQVKNMRTTVSLHDADPSAVTFDKAKVLALLIHSSDISHPGRPWHLHFRWSTMLCQEFFSQGDREKELELTVSPLCDRVTTKVATSQVGFIDFVVTPTFELVIDMLERVLNPLFLQQKARSLDSREFGRSVPAGGTKTAFTENKPLAYENDYLAYEEENGEPCDFIPFRWDARHDILKIHRFHVKPVESNKAMWRKHIEDEANDPMLFKRFERDPVVELGWVWPDENDHSVKKAVSWEDDLNRKIEETLGGREICSKLKRKIEKHQQKIRDLLEQEVASGENDGNVKLSDTEKDTSQAQAQVESKPSSSSRHSRERSHSHGHKHRHHCRHDKESADLTVLSSEQGSAAGDHERRPSHTATRYEDL